jgi:hypothetical protein
MFPASINLEYECPNSKSTGSIEMWKQFLVKAGLLLLLVQPAGEGNASVMRCDLDDENGVTVLKSVL